MKNKSNIDKKIFLIFEKIIGKTPDETSGNLYLIFKVATLATIVVFLANTILRLDFLGLSDLKLGDFGDFFGGVLNPILTFLTFVGLLITIIVQKNELALTRDEFAKTAQALTEQSNSVKKQSFENTFFNLLKLHSETLNSLCLNKETQCRTTLASHEEQTTGRTVFSSILTSIHDPTAPENSLDNYTLFQNSKNHIVGHYFRGLYQILKFIEDSSLETAEKENYSRLLRAQLSTDELALLCFNCICPSVDSGQFRNLIINFKILEHLRLDKKPFWDNFSISGHTVYAKKTDLLKYVIFDVNDNVVKSAFGSNPVATQELYNIRSDSKTTAQYPALPENQP